MKRPRILFVFEHKYEPLWCDGLWAALNVLDDDFEIVKWNLAILEGWPADIENFDFILGWGGWLSPTDTRIRKLKTEKKIPKGLCIGGNAIAPYEPDFYDVLFFETMWYLPQIKNHPNIFHAFGINSMIYNRWKLDHKIWDYTTVGAFSIWKRQTKLLEKTGMRLAIGEIQKDNLGESMAIISQLLAENVMVSDMVPPSKLAQIYHASKTVYIPADENGGGERAIWEARACGCNVEIEKDNQKLKELVTGTIRDQIYYARQIKKGINSVVSSAQ